MFKPDYFKSGLTLRNCCYSTPTPSLDDFLYFRGASVALVEKSLGFPDRAHLSLLLLFYRKNLPACPQTSALS